MAKRLTAVKELRGKARMRAETVEATVECTRSAR